MKQYSNKSHSSYWLQDWEDDDIISNNFNETERKTHDLYKMSGVQRAISNFVNIVTNQQIPVRFNSRGNSYTDGKTVVIGANVIEPKDFDVAVGLALHEGSHIKLSDFKLLGNIYNLVPNSVTEKSIKMGIMNPISIIKDVWNYVEDRRIDNFVFNSAPGYREYYRSMYDKYFNDPIIDKGLLSDEYTEETIESYMFRIINLHNKNTDLSKLKGLREIYKLIGLGKIDRLKSSQDTFDVALDVFNVMLNNLTPIPQQDENENEGEGEGEGDGSGEGDDESTESQNGGGESNEDNEDSPADSNGNGSSEMSGDSDENDGGGSSMDAGDAPTMGGKETNSNTKGSNTSDLSTKQKDLLKKKIQNQRKFMNGDVTKKTITKNEEKSLEAIEESGSEIKNVGNEVQNPNGRYQKGIGCVVVNKLTKTLLNSDIFPLTYIDWQTKEARRQYESEVAKGIQIGTILGKKLQVRSESRTTVYNRQRVGKIDKRLISSLGFGNENVFSIFETDSYKKANLHISLDASGSMSGEKWRQTVVNTMALCKAVDMIQNLSVQVSIRTTNSNSVPYIVMAYDSRVDKISKAKEVFTCVTPGGTTPEGLCFEAIINKFISAGNDFDSYFLNVSDGEPYFEGVGFVYQGEAAFNHTAKTIKQIEGLGIKTLSYFVAEGGYTTEPSRGFRKMYGNGAKSIDVTNVAQITKTMNELFLSK
jgi:hypothetical protein